MRKKRSKVPVAEVSGASKSIGFAIALLVGLIAVATPALAYFVLRQPAANAGSTQSLQPPVCPPDWEQCPRVAGVDWPSLLADTPAVGDLAAADLGACDASALLSPHAIRGMHAICMLPPPAALKGRAAAVMVVFARMERSAPQLVAAVPLQLSALDDLIAVLTRAVQMAPKPSDSYQPPALFTSEGVRLRSLGGALAARTLLLLEGGQWLWPPVEKGHAHVIQNLTAPGTTTRVVTVSLRPLVVEVPV